MNSSRTVIPCRSTGFPFSILLVTASPAYAGGVKSILGPEEFVIQ